MIARTTERPTSLDTRIRPGLRWRATALWTVAAAAAFAIYLELARTRAVNSDGAAMVLQAREILHGNPLLSGWHLTDVSFWTTEIPEDLLIVLVHGLSAGVVQIGAALTYTLVVLLSVALAKGATTGREAIIRIAVTAGILLAPELSWGTNELLSSPDHIGTTVPVLLAWLILDRAPRRWWVPVLVTAVLAWTAVADQLTVAIAAVPLIAVSLLRLRRSSGRWFELTLGVGGALVAATGLVAPRVVKALGGYVQPPVTSTLSAPGVILHHSLPVTGRGLLLLFGAYTPGLPTPQSWFAVLHLVSLVLVASGVALTARRFFSESMVPQLLLVGMVLVLGAYLSGFVHSDVVEDAREISSVVPFGAVLAARQIAPWLAARPSGRRVSAAVRAAVPVLSLALAGYTAGLAVELTSPRPAPHNARLAAWLERHPLGGEGFSGYWAADVVTLTSGEGIHVRAVNVTGGRLVPHLAESKSGWWDPARSYADFVVLSPSPAVGYPGFTDRASVLRSFGPPARAYHVGPYTILQWHKNLLHDMHKYLTPAERASLADK